MPFARIISLATVAALSLGHGSAASAGPVRGAVAAQVVDSLLPMAEELHRFRAGLGDPPRALTGGATSRTALVQGFVAALARRDTLALRSMLLSKAEFAFLYFPESEHVRPPYLQKPSLVWFRLAAVSERGIGRALARDGGRPMALLGYRCERVPLRRGKNSIWQGCRVRVRVDGAIVERRLFGSIVERGGRFKFLSYATDY